MAKARWWAADGEKIHETVFAMSSEMERFQARRREVNGKFLQLFDAKGCGISLSGDYITVSTASEDGVMATNIIRTAVDVLGAKIGRGKPKGSFVTTGGTWAEQRRASRLDRFVYGCMHAADFYRSARKVFRDAAVMDLGVLKGCVANGKIVLERVDPNDIKADLIDAYNGKPRTLVHSQVVSREVALSWVDEWHADKTEAERARLRALVEKAASGVSKRVAGHRLANFGDVVQVEEAWHLPSGPPDAAGKHDGRHVVALSTVALVDEPSTFFPFAFCRIVEPFNGFYGQGIAEILMRHQRAINGMMRRLRDIIHRMAVPRIYYAPGTKVQQEQMVDGGSVVTITGTSPPTVIASNSVPPELWRGIDEAISRGLEQVGVSPSASAATKPAGLTSGQALRDYQDIQSERHAPIHLSFEDFVLDACRIVVRIARKAAEDGQPITATIPRPGRSAESISWDAVAADEDSFVLQVHSTSNLPTTPAARKQYVEDMQATGQIDGTEARRLLDMPDTEASDQLALSARDAVDASLEAMLDGDDDEGAEDDYRPPEPFDDLAYAVKRGTAVYNRARVQGAPEARLALVRQYIIAADAMMKKATSAPPAQAPNAAPAAPSDPGGTPPPMQTGA